MPRRSGESNPAIRLREAREEFALRSDYAAAKSSRFRRTRGNLYGSADAHYASDAAYFQVMEYARDMDRNDSIVGAMVDRACDNVVQLGFQVDPQTGDKALDTDLRERWVSYAEDPDQVDTQGEMSFSGLERLAFRATLVDGDIFALPQEDGSLQFIEADRARTPTNTKRNVVHGVLLNDVRRRLEYWFTKDPGAKRITRVGEVTRVPARDDDGRRLVYHLYNPKRITQTRGVTAFSPIFDILGNFEDLNYAKLVQAQIVSCIAFFLTRSPTGDLVEGTDLQTGSREETIRSDGTTETEQGLSPGKTFHLAPGEDVQGFQPNVPNPEFFAHVRLLLQIVGINLGLPLVVGLMDASETNFSGFRGAVDEARRGFRRNQGLLKQRLHRPFYRRKVADWMASDPALRAAAKKSTIVIFKHRWQSPTWPYIEPLKDTQAAALKLSANLTSPRRLHAETGLDSDDVARETVEDNTAKIRLAIDAAQTITQETGEQISWREILGLNLPAGMQAVAAGTGDDPGDDAPEDKPNKDKDDAD